MIQLKLPFMRLDEVLAKLFHYRFGYWTKWELGLAWAQGEIDNSNRDRYWVYFDEDITNYRFVKQPEGAKFKMFIDPTRPGSSLASDNAAYDVSNVYNFIDGRRVCE